MDLHGNQFDLRCSKILDVSEAMFCCQLIYNEALFIKSSKVKIMLENIFKNVNVLVM
jgi:hypothetical protein